MYRKIDDSLVDDYTITTLRTTIEQLNGKKTKIVELHERIAALITDPNELTKAMIEIAKALRFIELQTQVEMPQPSPSSQSNTISHPSAAITEPPHLLSSPVPPQCLCTDNTSWISSDLTPQNTTSIVSSNPISSIVSLASMSTVSTVTTVPLISAPL